jgi:hypothetical protein
LIKQEAKENKSKIFNLLKILLCFVVTLPLLLWWYPVLLVVFRLFKGVYSISDSDLFVHSFLAIVPWIYAPFCYFSFTKFLYGKTLLVISLTMHLALGVWALIQISDIFFPIMASVSIALWSLLYVVNKRFEKQLR